MSADALEKVLFGLQQNRQLPPEPELEIELEPKITLLPPWLIGKQVMRGLVAGYNLGRVQAQMDKSVGCRSRDENLPVHRGEVVAHPSGLVYITIFSGEVEAETDAIYEALATAGVRRATRQEGPEVPRLGLAQMGRAVRRDQGQRQAIEQLLAAHLPAEFEVEKWRTDMPSA